MKTVFFDIDTQIDFLFPAGALYVPGAERLLPALAQLTRYAAEHSLPVVASMDAHAEDDPEFQEWPPHCVAGTQGQRKPADLLLERRATIPTTPGDYAIEGAQQIIVEKQTLDVFANPNLPRLLERLNAERYVVYGVATEYCIRCAITGLLKTGKRVELVGDGIRGIDPAGAERTLGEFAAAGGRITTLAEVAAR
ncbi:MAG: cysteine hydrolase family protein [Bryobacteraceae bacterium]